MFPRIIKTTPRFTAAFARGPTFAAAGRRYVHQEKATPLSERPSAKTDPYPLPLSQPGMADDPSAAPSASTEQAPGGGRGQTSLDQLDEELSLPQPLDRTGETVEAMRARLVYQTRKRGTLETDLILSTFAKEWLPGMSEEEMRAFDKATISRESP
ncbi:hypothetical protein QFC22_003531 [Naganishia vaughanmartiniae]|uniref:Uncharacterized protein n=1 Tax=Naganishia vaughanmartiniae TaxID=1424756 RepID=A0ACC2X6M8_9TREE|nr:hypothetical protein QFC22_003531 [Naganishia vaughanmartiniae]